MKLKFLDANIILRYLTNDLPAESLSCEQLLKEQPKAKRCFLLIFW